MQLFRDARQFGGLFIILAMMLTVVSVIAATEVATAHGEFQNGCSIVPDSGPGFNFHDACDRHDLCYTPRDEYANGRPYGDDAAGRKGCDDAFLRDMRSACNQRWRRWYQRPVRAFCKGVAYTYYVGVRAAGGFYW